MASTGGSQSVAGDWPDSGDHACLALPQVGEFTRLSLWMAGSIAGVVSDTHASLACHFRDMALRLGWQAGHGQRKPARPTGDVALGMLAEALVGTRRAAVVSVFGPPRYAVTDRNPGTASEDVESARVWYFAMSSPNVSAVAVEFSQDIVSRVVFMGLSQAA